MGPEFEEAERGFWEHLFAGMEPAVREKLEQNADAIQLAVLVGTVMGVFHLEGGEVFAAQVPIKALPRFLTYRIPLKRGADPPYSS
jgi:hypothetical protein